MKKVKYKDFGNRLLNCRLKRNLTQKECLQGLGDITISMISNWENGYVFPSQPYLMKIVDFYKVSLDYLILGKNMPGANTQKMAYMDLPDAIITLVDSDTFKISYREDNISDLTFLFAEDKKVDDFLKDFARLKKARDFLNDESYFEALQKLKSNF